MEPGYDIDYDPALRLARLTLRGLWDRAMFATYERDLLARFPVTGPVLPGGRVLLDLRAHSIQAQDVAKDFETLFLRYSVRVDRYAVLLSGSALQKMQVQRLGTSATIRFTTSEAEALEWLCGGGLPAETDGEVSTSEDAQ